LNKWDYIKLISEKDDKYGSLLLELMDRYSRFNLQEIAEDDAKMFYEEILRKEKEK